MQMYKDSSDIEQAFQEVEAFMREKGISICAMGTVLISFKGKEAILRDAENGEIVGCIPRQLESERLALIE